MVKVYVNNKQFVAWLPAHLRGKLEKANQGQHICFIREYPSGIMAVASIELPLVVPPLAETENIPDLGDIVSILNNGSNTYLYQEELKNEDI